MKCGKNGTAYLKSFVLCERTRHIAPLEASHISRHAQDRGAMCWGGRGLIVLEILGWVVYGLGGYLRNLVGGWGCVISVDVYIATYIH